MLIIAHAERVRDNLLRTRFAVKLASRVKDDTSTDNAVWHWLSMVVLTDSVEGYEIPQIEESSDDIWAKFEQYLDWPQSRADEWEKAVVSAQVKPSAEVAPLANVSEEQQSNPNS